MREGALRESVTETERNSQMGYVVKVRVLMTGATHVDEYMVGPFADYADAKAYTDGIGGGDIHPLNPVANHAFDVLGAIVN
jgi:hypothetical protein